MRFALRVCVVLLCTAFGGRTAEPAAEDLYRAVRNKVLSSGDSMPRYTCVETITRHQYDAVGNYTKPPSCTALLAMRKTASPGRPLWQDRLRVEVAVVNGQEMFSWPGAGAFDAHNVDALVGAGASGSGDFVSFMMSIFGGDPDRIGYRGLENGRGIFEDHVSQARSHYRYRHTANGPDKIVSYSGTFEVDPAEHELRRLYVETGEFPGGETACKVDHTMDYHRVKLGDGEFLLPEVSTMNVLFQDGEESRAETRYSGCREFKGESTIHFDDAVSAGSDASGVKTTGAALPAGLRLKIALSEPVVLATAATGDAIQGVLLASVSDGKRGQLARANDRVRGRILRLQEAMSPWPRWTMAIRFDVLEHDGVEVPLNLKNASGPFVFLDHDHLTLDRKFRSEWLTQ